MSHNESPTWVPRWTLADRLRKIRRDSHLTQDDFAHVLGIKPTTYAAWEAGRNEPERILELASRIEDTFDVPAAWILGLMDRPKVRATDRAEAQPVELRRSTDRVPCFA